MAGGAMMLLVGSIYLLYQDTILGRAVPKTSLSRHIIGAQVSHYITTMRTFVDDFQIGLILLSMLTTYHGASSLQAKSGLPLGTQIVGWLVLSKLSML
jgi:phosphatidylinositol glycan class N